MNQILTLRAGRAVLGAFAARRVSAGTSERLTTPRAVR